MSWISENGVERVCSGSLVRFGEPNPDQVLVHQTPGEVHTAIRSASSWMVELQSQGDPDIPVYIDRRQIVAITPIWSVVPS